MQLASIRFLLTLTMAAMVSGEAMSAPCQGAKLDSDVFWAGLHHNSFETKFRDQFGAVKTNQGQVRLRFRTCMDDVESVRVRVWDDRINAEYWLAMEKSYSIEETDVGPVDFWQAAVQIPTYPTILYYFFEINDGSDTDYYIDTDVRKFSGGPGRVVSDWNDSSSFSITVYDKDFRVPDWFKGALVYQIFPDRFRNGNRDNDPAHGQHWVNGRRATLLHWNEELCDPRTSACFNHYDNQFYGGDLEGIIEKLPYLKEMGVQVLYLNPIFMSASNHKYDTQDFLRIDPNFGDLTTFHQLVAESKRLGMRVILDGVFNHTSADSPYFDYFSRWNAAGEVTSVEGPGIDDGSGACESPNSRFREWYYLPAHWEPALNEARTKPLTCPRSKVNEPGESPMTYDAWFGYYTLPKLRTDSLPVKKLFYLDNETSVGPYWINQGAAGWRLDVGGNVDPGFTVDPNNLFWEEFRTAIKRADSDAVIIGEEWGNATPWLLGHEWDSTMNYRLRSALLDWMFDGCQGLGCVDNKFHDNDSNGVSHSGPIEPISESQFKHRLLSIQEDYPEEAWRAMLNLLGSHDTNRIFFLLKQISNGDGELATAKHKMLATFIFTYPGAPTIYYGDEAGVEASGVWDGRTWQDDPYNRVPFPWADQGYRPDLKLMEHYKALSDLHSDSNVLRTGGYETILSDDKQRLFGFARTNHVERIVVLFNRSHEERQAHVTLAGVNASTSIEELFSQEAIIASPRGRVSVNLPPLSSKVLVVKY